MSFLVDTDICSAHLNQVHVVYNRFQQYSGGIYLSVMTLGELTTWAWRSKSPPRRKQALQDLVNEVSLLEITEAIATKFGEVRAYLLDQGRPMDKSDLLIAATALVHNLTLVTHNTRHFIHVPGLSLADWLVP